jgi:uncharacterized membrane protein YdcZ (DUF606 family)
LLLEQQQRQQGEQRRQWATQVVVAWVAYWHVGLRILVSVSLIWKPHPQLHLHLQPAAATWQLLVGQVFLQV